MSTQSKPSLIDTIRFLRAIPTNTTSEQVQLHLENLLYMSSILYMDDKKNVKHLKRINEIIAAMERKFCRGN